MKKVCHKTVREVNLSEIAYFQNDFSVCGTYKHKPPSYKGREIEFPRELSSSAS